MRQAHRQKDGFVVRLEKDQALRRRKLLLATGTEDKLPDIENIQRFYGRSVFHCPYCDGWEMRDQPLAAYGCGERALGLARALLTWTDDVVLCTDGGRSPPADRMRVISKRIARLEGRSDMLERMVFADGETLHRRGMFFHTGQRHQCDLAERFGCVFTPKGTVRTDRFGATNIPGLYVAGDASHDVQFAIVAAAEGAKAAVAINTALQVAPRE